MSMKRVFISFDYDYDEDLRRLLIGQSKHPESPFDISDWSLKDPISGDWKEKIRHRIRCVDVVCVICGFYTDNATGVSTELSIAREESIPYFLLNGRTAGTCKKPKSAINSDKLYNWTWDNLKALINGDR